jgi:hypothetical protein
MTSSLKTFLKDKDLLFHRSGVLTGAKPLYRATGYFEEDEYLMAYVDASGEIWATDVLDDGTAVTYCLNV